MIELLRALLYRLDHLSDGEVVAITIAIGLIISYVIVWIIEKRNEYVQVHGTSNDATR